MEVLSPPVDGQDIARRGQAIYESLIRPVVEPGNNGKLLVLNLDTGKYEMDSDDVVAAKRARSRFPDAPLFTLRVGFPAAYRHGGASAVRRP